MVFDHHGTMVSLSQREHHQHYPKPGWVEHDAGRDLVDRETGRAQCAGRRRGRAERDRRPRDHQSARDHGRLGSAHRSPRRSGHRVAGHQDHRVCWRRSPATSTRRSITLRTGLPLAGYFSGPKLRWILDHDPAIRERAERGDLLFGTMDSWITWNLTGGLDGGLHVTDVTNASRTMLMNLETLDWDPVLLAALRIPRTMLPEIRPTIGRFGTTVAPVPGIPIGALIGDQQASLFGQTAFDAGRGEMHVRHRKFPAAQYRPGDRPVRPRADHHGRPQDRRRAGRLRAGGFGRRRGRTGAVVPGQPRSDQDRRRDRDPGRHRCRTTAVATWCRRSRACSHRGGIRPPRV